MEGEIRTHVQRAELAMFLVFGKSGAWADEAKALGEMWAETIRDTYKVTVTCDRWDKQPDGSVYQSDTEGMGIHESFVRKLVWKAVNSKAALDQFNAARDVKAGRLTLTEAAGYTNLDENPDAFYDALPWGPSRAPGLAKSSTEYAILVLDADGHATIFRGFPTCESAQDALKKAQASLATPIAALPTDRAYVFSADGRSEETQERRKPGTMTETTLFQQLAEGLAQRVKQANPTMVECINASLAMQETLTRLGYDAGIFGCDVLIHSSEVGLATLRDEAPHYVVFVSGHIVDATFGQFRREGLDIPDSVVIAPDVAIPMLEKNESWTGKDYYLKLPEFSVYVAYLPRTAPMTRDQLLEVLESQVEPAAGRA